MSAAGAIVSKVFLKFVASLTVGAAAFAFAAAPTAGAVTPHATSSSFVGTYKTKIELPGDTKFRNGGEITLNADGTSPAGGKKVAHWSNDGTNLTITFTMHKHVEVLAAVQTAKSGLSTKTAPGTVSIDGAPTGLLWYAVKIS
jgi:hypothetical protein